VGRFSKGYWVVTTFLNMVLKVTPKPATGSQNCSLRVAIYLSSAAVLEGMVSIVVVVNAWPGIGGTG
jgi:hypothetical protein